MPGLNQLTWVNFNWQKSATTRKQRVITPTVRTDADRQTEWPVMPQFTVIAELVPDDSPLHSWSKDTISGTITWGVVCVCVCKWMRVFVCLHTCRSVWHQWTVQSLHLTISWPRLRFDRRMTPPLLPRQSNNPRLTFVLVAVATGRPLLRAYSSTCVHTCDRWPLRWPFWNTQRVCVCVLGFVVHWV